MITKAIVSEIVDNYSVKVRVPRYDGVSFENTAVSDEDLSIAYMCTLPNMRINPVVGDVVFIEYEDNDQSKPIIVGYLFREDVGDTVCDIIADSLTIKGDTHLSSDTTIGNVTPNEIESLSGIKGNIQGQIDNLGSIEYLRGVVKTYTLNSDSWTQLQQPFAGIYKFSYVLDDTSSNDLKITDDTIISIVNNNTENSIKYAFFLGKVTHFDYATSYVIYALEKPDVNINISFEIRG